jgi:SAM-dependent methyltransferase
MEVGCGDGRLTLGVAGQAASVYAFDPDEAAVRRARRSLPPTLAGHVTYRVASAADIPLEPGAYDIVLFSWSLCCMEPSVVVHVVRRFREVLVPGGVVLDLQVIRPDPRVELDGRLVCEIDGTPLFAWADAARAAVDLFVAQRLLEEEALDDHDVLQHYESGAALIEEWAPKKRKLPAQAIPVLRTMERECIVRERCRLRRLRRVEPTR